VCRPPRHRTARRPPGPDRLRIAANARGLPDGVGRKRPGEHAGALRPRFAPPRQGVVDDPPAVRGKHRPEWLERLHITETSGLAVIHRQHPQRILGILHDGIREMFSVRRPRFGHVHGPRFRRREPVEPGAADVLLEDRDVALTIGLEGHMTIVRRPDREAVAAAERQPAGLVARDRSSKTETLASFPSSLPSTSRVPSREARTCSYGPAGVASGVRRPSRSANTIRRLLGNPSSGPGTYMRLPVSETSKAAPDVEPRPTSQQLEHVSILAGAGARINSDEFWRGPPPQRCRIVMCFAHLSRSRTPSSSTMAVIEVSCTVSVFVDHYAFV